MNHGFSDPEPVKVSWWSFCHFDLDTPSSFIADRVQAQFDPRSGCLDGSGACGAWCGLGVALLLMEATGIDQPPAQRLRRCRLGLTPPPSSQQVYASPLLVPTRSLGCAAREERAGVQRGSALSRPARDRTGATRIDLHDDTGRNPRHAVAPVAMQISSARNAARRPGARATATPSATSWCCSLPRPSDVEARADAGLVPVSPARGTAPAPAPTPAAAPARTPPLATVPSAPDAVHQPTGEHQQLALHGVVNVVVGKRWCGDRVRELQRRAVEEGGGGVNGDGFVVCFFVSLLCLSAQLTRGSCLEGRGTRWVTCCLVGWRCSTWERGHGGHVGSHGGHVGVIGGPCRVTIYGGVVGVCRGHVGVTWGSCRGHRGVIWGERGVILGGGATLSRTWERGDVRLWVGRGR